MVIFVPLLTESKYLCLGGRIDQVVVDGEDGGQELAGVETAVDIAFPAILTAVFQFSIGFVTVGFVGHIGEVELAAVTVVENVIEGFAYGVLLNY
ncbi:protein DETOXIFICATION 33 [Hordeum vulgare]|nr:protein DETOXIFICATION 33 [Hordeum vulgare]